MPEVALVCPAHLAVAPRNSMQRGKHVRKLRYVVLFDGRKRTKSGADPLMKWPRIQYPVPAHLGVVSGRVFAAPDALVAVGTMANAAPATRGGPSRASTAPPPGPVTCTAEAPAPSAAAPRRVPAKIRLVQYATGAGDPLLSLLDARRAFSVLVELIVAIV